MPTLDLFRHAEEKRTYQPGETLYQAGDVGNDMLVILEGTVDVLIGDRVVRSFGPGEIVGEMAIVDDRHIRAATVRANDTVTVTPVDTRHFDFLVRNHPSFARDVMKTIADRLRYMNEATRT